MAYFLMGSMVGILGGGLLVGGRGIWLGLGGEI